MAEAKTKELVKKRGTIKSKTTLFGSYLKPLQGCRDLSELQVIELESRFAKFEDLYALYDDFQTELEMLADSPTELQTEREAFESQYYGTLAIARSIITRNKKTDYASAVSSDVQPHDQPKRNFVKLPQIDLPKFSGNYHNWLEFRDTFTSLIHNQSQMDDIIKLHYLRASVKGSALLVIDSLDYTSANYNVAWTMLCERYDNKRLLVNDHVQSLFNVETIRTESSTSLRHLLDATKKNLRALSTLGQPTQHWDTLIIHIMAGKLDSVTNREWEEHRNFRSDLPSIETFTSFISNRADLLETLEKSRHNLETSAGTANKTESYIVATNVSQKGKRTYSHKPSCPFCKGSHLMYSCGLFKKLSVDSRIENATKANVCLNCLCRGHKEAECKSIGCKYCGTKHHTLLHREVEKIKQTHENVQNFSADSHSSNPSTVLLLTALVKVLDNKGRSQSARVLLDCASTGNFISEEYCRKLQLKTTSIGSKVNGINNLATESSQSCSITLESSNQNYQVDVDCHVIPNITKSLPHTYVQIQDLPLPSDISLADPSFNVPSSIDVLVGAELFWNIVSGSRIEMGKNKPTLVESKFGWLLSGGVGRLDSHNQSSCFFTDNNQADIDLTRFWELDTIPAKHILTPEERQCEEHFISTTRRNSDGRFVVSVPLKQSTEALGSSFEMAKRRFLSLERRFERDTHLKSLYVDFMDEYISLNHMTEKPNLDSHEPGTYFLPHHGVYRESSTTTKLRVVYDASAKTTSGKSSNDIQLVGPTVQDDLLSILMRFRQHKYVFSADIEKMYRQFLTDEKSSKLQQILWRSDQNLPLKSYTLNTVTYGTASAPYLATRCLVQLAHENPDPVTRHSILHDFYVDDYLSGSNSIEDAVKLCQDVTVALSSAKLNLRKWQSNSMEILQAISKDHKPIEQLSLSHNDMSKTLGINWKCFLDTFAFSINITHKDKITKRHILSTIAQVFDPLGLVAPCFVQPKVIMQQLWINKCSWDECVPNNILKVWTNFEKTLPALNELQIPRWVICDQSTNTQLHVFSDASEKAYGACVYLRSVSRNGTVHVHLVTAKSKVAPIKAMTMPRLELCGALLGARLYLKVTGSLTVKFDDCTFWSDSTIVLGWLASSPLQLKPFVRHRVSEIQEGSSGHTWRYVPSGENPADHATRGLDAEQIASSSIWWSGPEFLKAKPAEWPPFPNPTFKTELPEVIQTHSVNLNVDNAPSNLFQALSLQLSSLTKLQRVTAYVLKFVSITRNVNTTRSNFLTSRELSEALDILLQTSQQEAFPTEYEALQLGKVLPVKNRLLPLSPFMDAKGLIRVGGRLKNSYYDYNVKHPILLSSQNQLCKLLFDKYHKELCHAGPHLLLATVRQNYWPLGGRNLSKSITRSCVKCCRIKGATIQPVMGNLPEQRVHLEFPFLDTGVDYAGPIMIADRKGRGCKLVKCYISVFICLATKAVHLELVSDLTKDAFIAALNRFIARRGKPRNIFSDNGTTFVGAFNELSKLLDGDLSSRVSNLGLKFSFIPAYTPHFGGLWESAVKSIKHHLRRILSLTNLTFEEMSTCLSQIEAILNSRPLTPLSDDPTDLSPLTPAHFLIGRSLIALPHEEITSNNINSLQRFRRIQLLKQHFWSRFSFEYVSWLQQKTKWCKTKGALTEGSLVVVKDKTTPPLMWVMGRVIRLLPGQDGIARVADIKTQKGIIRRAYNTICPLPVPSSSFDH